ncbi:MAG: metal ABC transporter ATP-binding protein [Gemmatimonadetes bacterium]|nr:metal ABC transporter ATP-binding protein [Gemmatimonadota bacterium]
MSHLISFEGVTLAYGRRTVLEGLDFDIEEGEVLGLVGPNGGGKTTVLKALLGVLQPVHGRVVRHGPGVRFGYVPQRSRLDERWPLRTIDVVLMGLYPQAGLVRRPSRAHVGEASAMLEYVALGPQAQLEFSTLSGGQKQRTLLARALITKPDILVLDEPTSGLDVAGTTHILRIVADLHRERALTVLLSSHDLNTVANHVQRVALVVSGAFRIGPAEEVLTSAALSHLYGLPIAVERVGGRVAIVASSGAAT